MTTKEPVNIAGVATEIEEILDKTDIKQPGGAAKMSIGISISNSSQMESIGFTLHHLEDALTETARYLLANDYHLIYGGDLRIPGFTYQLADLAKLYTPQLTDHISRVRNYLAWPLHLPVTVAQEANFMNMGVTLKRCEAPIGVDKLQYLKPDNIETRIIWAESLLQMRMEIVQAADARIVLGGQLSGYIGRLPGVVEEAWLSLQANKPLYLCGAWGGAAKSVIDAIETNQSTYLTEEWQCLNPETAAFIVKWNEMNPHEAVNYTQIIKNFYESGIKGISSTNGLSNQENLRLFKTPHPQEMLYLILKGLSNIRKF